MNKRTCQLAFATLFFLITNHSKDFFLENWIYQNSSNQKLELPHINSASEKPNNLWCYCSDGTIYSYGNNCPVGWVGCEQHLCPGAPPGCSGN